MTGIEKVLAAENGSRRKVAEKLSTPECECPRQLVEYWKKRGYVTPKWVLLVNRVYRVPVHELNPTIYSRTQVA